MARLKAEDHFRHDFDDSNIVQQSEKTTVLLAFPFPLSSRMSCWP